MKHILKVFALLISINVLGQKMVSKKNIMAKMELANKYFMKKYPISGIKLNENGKVEATNTITRSIYIEGLLALNDVKPNKKFIKYANSWGDINKWNINNGLETRNAADQACGQVYIDLFLKDRSQTERITSIKANIDSMVAYHKIDDWNKIEALNYAMPILAKLGVEYKDEKYFEKMFQMYMYTKTVEGLYSDQEFLWYRDKSFMPPYKTPKGQNCFWARGNGLVLSALVRILDVMPNTAPHYDEYLDTYREMMIAMLNLQREDGFWNTSLTDAENFGGKELTGTALITYSMAWGIRTGKIDATTFTPLVAKAMSGMLIDCVHKNGALGWIQGPAIEPKDSQPISFDQPTNYEDLALGCFLLAGSEVVRLSLK
jgi:unsaturated rhamnogalacturonyl hydrolase